MMTASASMPGYKEIVDTLDAIGGAKARTALRQCMKRGLTVVVRGIKGKIGNRAKTKGHSLTRVRRAVGRRVKVIGDKAQGKVGYGVGKKRGSYAPHGLFKLWGTVDRYTGAKTQRAKFFGVKSKYLKSTGKARRFRGRVPEGNFVEEGYAASEAEAARVMEDVANNALLREMIPSPESDFETD